ncbi:MFS transporter [Thermanaeromonas sp. C210]|uniref:MFS transporter n=1 Tax=Thermanaeromonas sp. C210 TaxID=2731925 RepID=UPI00155D27F2|nr:MFS transporter [Thermanaeromonas sp. C210]GFN22483.1 MFS transporter [Thermanaeromonas sp. C210]
MEESQQLASSRSYALLVCTLASFLTPFMGSSINLAIPAIGAEFHAEALSLNWVVSAFLLTSAAFLLPLGRLADLYGRRKMFLGGLAGYTLFSFLSTLAPSLPFLIVARALHGISCAMIFSTAVAILISTFPAHSRGRVLGINAAAVYAGLSAGPFLGGIITHYLGWRFLFGINALVGLVTLVIAWAKLRGEWVGAHGEKFDWAGSLLSVLSLAAVIYGASTFSLGALSRWLFFVGLGGILLFVWQEARAPFPLLNVRLFRGNPAFTFSNLAALINYSATYAVGYLLSLYLQVAKGLDSQTAGLILLVQPVVQVLLSPVAGQLSDRVEPRIVASAGMGLTSLGLLVLSTLRLQSPIPLIVANLLLLGFGFALFSSPNTNAVMSSAPRAYYGVASSILGTMRLLGQAFSMAIVTIMFNLYFRGIQIAPQHADLLVKSMNLSFIAFTVFSVGGIFASLARGQIHH